MRHNPANDPAACVACRRHATGLGIGNPGGSPRWVCVDCISAAWELRAVRSFDHFELTARRDAGEKAGEFLDMLNKSDLADLTEGEWLEFLTKIIDGFGNSIRRQVTEDAAPF